MVATAKANGKTAESKLELEEDLLEAADTDLQEAEQLETNWRDARPVRVLTIPLNPEMLDGEYYHQSAPTKKNPEGLYTITDIDFVKYRVGHLVSPIEDYIRSLEPEELKDFVLGSIIYHNHVTEEKEALVREAKKAELLEKAAKKYERVKGLLVAANPQMKKWTKDQFVNWIAENMDL